MEINELYLGQSVGQSVVWSVSQLVVYACHYFINLKHVFQMINRLLLPEGHLQSFDKLTRLMLFLVDNAYS